MAGNSEWPIELRCPTLGRLWTYWLGRCRDGALPARRDLDPLDIPFALSRLALVDVLRAPLRFRFRLMGTDIVSRMGVDLTGKMLDQYPDPEQRQLMLERYRHVAETAAPLALDEDRVLDGKLWNRELLFLPLALDGALVDMVMVGITYRQGAR